MASSDNLGGRPWVKLPVDGVQCQALIDTGASHSLISESVYNKLPRITPLMYAPTLTSLSGHKLETRGTAVVKLPGVGAKDVVVCPELCFDMLLGSNVLKDVVLDLPQLTMVLGNEKFPLKFLVGDGVESVTHCIPKAPSKVLEQVLEAYKDVFSPKGTPVKASTNLPEITIETTCPPIRQQSYRIPMTKRAKVEECVKEMLADGVIRPSSSPWASPITLVPKKDGTTRFCVDYRKLNAHTVKDAHPLPHIQDVFDQLKGARIFSTLDLKSGYWQIPVAENYKAKTAFTCHLGLFEFNRMPFGLTNAPAVFQRTITKVLAGLVGRICMVYIDDIIVYSSSEAEHAKHLGQVLERLKQAGLQLKPNKCTIGQTEVELLGYLVSDKGIKPLPDKVQAIQEMTPPQDVRGVRAFLGMAGYYRQAIPRFSEIAEPLIKLTRKCEPFIWGTEQTDAFERLKVALTNAPILACPDPSRPFRLYTDASQYAVGAILVQDSPEGEEKVIAYLSHSLSETQRRWASIEREAFAVVYALKKLHVYLWGARFEIHTDHKPLTSLFRAEIKNTKVQRWAIQIAEYGAPILYHPGKKNIRADMLSRICTLTPTTEYILPEVSIPWGVDGLDLPTVMKDQKREFPSERLEAQQELDSSGYILLEDILYATQEPHPAAGVYPRLVLPSSARLQVMTRCHQEVGHQAFLKTLMRVQENYVWPGMRKEIRAFVEKCPECNITSTRQPPRAERGEMPIPPCPLHTWGLDIVSLDKSKNGNKYLLTCVDHLTGWAEAIPLPFKTNEAVWNAFTAHIVSRYGLPAVIVTDNGGEFTATKWREWLRECGVEHRRTTPYHPQCNGKVERFNGTLVRILTKLVRKPEMWEEYLPDALYAYRISKHSATCLSPYQQLYGQRARVPGAAVPGDTPGQRLKNIRTTTLHAQSELKKQATKAREKWNKKLTSRLQAGDYVSLRVQHPTKLSLRWNPGFQIIDKRGPVVTVKNLDTQKVSVVNEANIKRLDRQREYDLVPKRPHRNQPKDQVSEYPAHPQVVPRENQRYGLRPRVIPNLPPKKGKETPVQSRNTLPSSAPAASLRNQLKPTRQQVLMEKQNLIHLVSFFCAD